MKTSSAHCTSTAQRCFTPNSGPSTCRVNFSVFLFFLSLWITLPATAQKKEWKTAKETNTIEAYKEYANRFPSSKFAAQARDSACTLGFKKARQIHSIDAYRQFLYDCKGYKPRVEPFLCELYFNKARSANTIGEYRYYLEQCPKSKNTADAADILYGLRFAEAEEKNTPDAMRAFLNECKECRYANNAKRILDSLEWMETAKEDRLFSYYSYIISTEINSIPGSHKESAIKLFSERLETCRGLSYHEVEEEVNSQITPLTLDEVKTPGKVSRPSYGNTSRYVPGRGIVNVRTYNGTTEIPMTDGYSSQTTTTGNRVISIDRSIVSSIVKTAVVTINAEGEKKPAVTFKYFDNSNRPGALAEMDLRILTGNDHILLLKVKGRWYTFSEHP